MAEEYQWWDGREEDEFPMDFGSGCRGKFIQWSPDRDLNPQYKDIPDESHYMVLWIHPDARDTTKKHVSGFTLDTETARKVDPNKPKWQVISLDPLHVEPSILCTLEKGGCGAHGWIREGKWVTA